MISFKKYYKRSAAGRLLEGSEKNTAEAVVNELAFIFFLTNEGDIFNLNQQWNYKSKFFEQFKKAGKANQNAIDKALVAKEMAKAFIKKASEMGFSNIERVIWTAQDSKSMQKAIGGGIEIDQKKNPADALAKFNKSPDSKKPWLGASLKAKKGAGNVPFKNAGWGTVEEELNLGVIPGGISIKNKQEDSLKELIKELNFSDSFYSMNNDGKKAFIEKDPNLKKLVNEKGFEILEMCRDKMLEGLNNLSQVKILNYLVNSWLDGGELYPRYIKITGNVAGGKNKVYSAHVWDPVKNPVVDALQTEKITFNKKGRDSIDVMAGGIKIFKIRVKYSSVKLASSVKLSGEDLADLNP
jgi:hypothetical protein